MDLREPPARLIVSDLPRPGKTVEITDEEVAHARARRLRPGDSVILLDGSGREASGRIVRLERRRLQVSVEAVRRASERPELHLSLYVAGVRGEPLAWIAEKATELGVERLLLVRSERAQSFRASGSHLARLERVLRAAVKQSGRARWPLLAGPIPLARALKDERAPHRFLLDFDADPFPSRLPSGPAAILVGPEGGWSSSEREQASGAGWACVSLPAGRLRTETAVVAALVLLRAALVREPNDL